MSQVDFDAVVIGAGVIGIACARAVAKTGLTVALLDKNDAFGAETSARNSEVIHAGIYYPTSSLKARLCIHGRDMLYAYCAERHIAHRKLGKLIVATDESEIDGLHKIHQQALANGVNDVRWLSQAETAEMEPAVHCTAALYSPSTGIVDSHALMLSMLGDVEENGGHLVLNCPVFRAFQSSGHWCVETADEERTTLTTHFLINSTGLHAEKFAKSIDGLESHHIQPVSYAKGSYFSLSGRCPFDRLIYPIPPKGGLGIHLTLDLAGSGRFGPDVTWSDEIEYTLDDSKRDAFFESIQRYWPDVPKEKLLPAYAGVRPKIHDRAGTFADFCISGPNEHGLRGLVNLFGIESPGLTSSMAIADEVVSRLGI
ncbi:NAD(P)/FAD-dependent oxidoreductase [Vogesella indigofera]|uniref:NAD(P)/FAD-dependent oxidoreductase n=1 Tax=Vogesella indigofera TaxID=45465 RepID=UPI0035B3128B